MKTIPSTATILIALAGVACGSGESPGSEPGAQATSSLQSSSGPHAVALPPQFAGQWRVVEDCPSQQHGTGLEKGDIIEIEQRVGIKLTLPNGTRVPDPTLLQGLTLAVANPQGTANQNVLTSNEVSLLCSASPEGFPKAFSTVLYKHNYNLTYLTAIADLHPHDLGPPVLVIFLPYMEGQASPSFFLAVVSLGDHDQIKISNHNGIVHGSQ